MGDWKDEYGPDLSRIDQFIQHNADLLLPIALCVFGALLILWMAFGLGA
jgi:hypothetical protein